MLEIREVTKNYSGRPVVNRVSFEVGPGEIMALLGPNGAGKTTLIRMITDIIRPDSGSITLDGKPVGGEEKRRISYLPEERGLYRRSKLIDVLEYFGRLKGLTRTAARAAGLALLERVELAEWADKQVQSLSKGMQQKVQICTTLIGDPRILILDEPFSGLDPINVQLLEEILEEQRARGVSVLLSTHQMNKVEQLCDRALMINHGFMVLYGRVAEIRRRHADHAVRVRAAQSLPQVPGVRAIEAFNGDRKLTLEPGASPQSVLRALIERGVEVEAFEVAILPLEDLFVKVVKEGLGLDHGASGPVVPSSEPEPAAVGAPR
jgi:ABC-2 type transport system ATP-binding protein